MILLIQLNGRKENLLEAHKLNEREIKTVKVDEKKLASLGFMRRLINEERYERILFGCIELSLQRFQTFMKLYILLSKTKKGAIIDESGASVEFKLIRHLFAELPLLALEAAVSAFVAGYFYIKLPVLKWRLTKKS